MSVGIVYSATQIYARMNMLYMFLMIHVAYIFLHLTASPLPSLLRSHISFSHPTNVNEATVRPPDCCHLNILGLGGVFYVCVCATE